MVGKFNLAMRRFQPSKGLHIGVSTSPICSPFVRLQFGGDIMNGGQRTKPAIGVS